MVRGARLSEVLGKANAASALLALLDQHPDHLGIIELADRMGGNKNMGRPMAEHLSRLGLAAMKSKPGIGGHTAYEIRLTERGVSLARALEAALAAVPDEPTRETARTPDEERRAAAQERVGAATKRAIDNAREARDAKRAAADRESR